MWHYKIFFGLLLLSSVEAVESKKDCEPLTLTFDDGPKGSVTCDGVKVFLKELKERGNDFSSTSWDSFYNDETLRTQSFGNLNKNTDRFVSNPTESIIEILKSHKIQATFFVLGSAIKSLISRVNECLKSQKIPSEESSRLALAYVQARFFERMKREGHLIASHTSLHVPHGALTSTAVVQDHLYELESYVGKYLSAVVRMPGGLGAYSNQIRKTYSVISKSEQSPNDFSLDIFQGLTFRDVGKVPLLMKEGYHPVYWNVDTKDFIFQDKAPHTIVSDENSAVLSVSKSVSSSGKISLPEDISTQYCYNGDRTVLMHDIHAFSARNLDYLISYMKKNDIAIASPLVAHPEWAAPLNSSFTDRIEKFATGTPFIPSTKAASETENTYKHIPLRKKK